jgi:hypothetical protein
MAVSALTYGSKIWTITTTTKTTTESKTAELKCFRSVASCTKKGQSRNTKIREELNISNLNNNILKSRSQ